MAGAIQLIHSIALVCVMHSGHCPSIKVSSASAFAVAAICSQCPMKCLLEQSLGSATAADIALSNSD